MHSTQRNKLLLVLFVVVFALTFVLEAQPAASKPVNLKDKGEVHEQ